MMPRLAGGWDSARKFLSIAAGAGRFSLGVVGVRRLGGLMRPGRASASWRMWGLVVGGVESRRRKRLLVSFGEAIVFDLPRRPSPLPSPGVPGDGDWSRIW